MSWALPRLTLRFFQPHLPRAQEITSFPAVNTRADSTHFRRLRRFSNSSLWFRALTDTSRLLPASVTRTLVPTVHRASSISSTLKWLLQRRRTFLQLQRRFCTKHSRSSRIKRFQSLRLHVFPTLKVWLSTVRISPICAIRL